MQKNLRLQLALKVDVDTLVGYQEGVPALLALFRDKGVRASFFVAMGPDNSGRAIRRLFTRKGFLTKMLRTGAPRLYGLKTLAYGTLLPAPMIAESNPNLLRALAAAGHEVGLHAYDHVYWHDYLWRLAPEQVHVEILRAQKVFVKIMGYPATAFAAPGWQCSLASRQALAAENFQYASDTRGYCPYFPRFMSGERKIASSIPRLPSPVPRQSLLEIPTTLPTMDELLGLNGATAADFNRTVIERLRPGQVEVLTIHAEVEGRSFFPGFAQLLEQLQARQVEFVRLGDWAQQLLAQPGDLPVAPVISATLPGRAGELSCQGTCEVSP